MINNEILEELWSIKDRLSKEASNDLHDYCAKINAAAKEKGFTVLKSISENNNISFAVAEKSTTYKV